MTYLSDDPYVRALRDKLFVKRNDPERWVFGPWQLMPCIKIWYSRIEDLNNINVWILNNCRGDVAKTNIYRNPNYKGYSDPNAMYCEYAFEFEEDAVAFKLRWANHLASG